MPEITRMKDITFRIHQSCTILSSIFFCISIINVAAVFGLSSGNETDRLALLAFKDKIIEDPLNVLSTWNSSNHCDWSGISCSEKNPGRVTNLDLGSRKLTSSFPPHLGNLTFLTEINLENNSFRGELPQELGLLSQLKYLYLGENMFEGEIPKNLSYCSELEVIDLTHNTFSGEIPIEFSSLGTKKLEYFYVSTNGLSGEIPLWLGNATSLTALSMADNKFQGNIPAWLGKLKSLMLLQIGGNNLTGTVPISIYNISSLLYLDMGDNELYGELPSDIGITLPNLMGIYMGRNSFTGSFPASLVNASGLEQIDLSDNNFTGTIPSNLGRLKELSDFVISLNMFESAETEGLNFLTSLTNCRNLTFLDIGYNRFKGELPSLIGNFSANLEQLLAGSNQIFGTIPKEVGNLASLTRLVLSSNLITGEIPVEIGNLKRLEDLRLFGNKISGQIPPSIGYLTRLSQLQLDTNRLSGDIPASLGNCRQLKELHLYGNKLTGPIPKEVANISSISLAFNLANNSLTGTLPVEIGDMNNLLDLDVSGNNFTGEIPSTISHCIMLEKLNLQGNWFSGPIPSALSALSSLHILNLSGNKFSGKIPGYLQNLTLLQKVDLSFNNLEGEIPDEGVFKNTTAFSIIGNSKLCGGIDSLGIHSCEISGSKKKGNDLALKIAVPVATFAFLVFFVCVFVYTHRKRKNSSNPTMSDPEEKFAKVSYKELLLATNNFSSSNLLGEGQYGSVYRGIFGDDKIEVAVKVIKLTEKGAAKGFISECNALKNIRHRNLIKIITTCSSIDSKGDDFKALVFKFVPNGSLEQWLHMHEGKENDQRSLSLGQRVDIATDIAYALEYLHHHCEIPIVHGDLKPSNILINNDMTAEVGDFGLARFLTDIGSNGSQHQANSTGIRGTVGYVALEYGMGSETSTKGDVYGFGILLLEMFTGQRPTSSLFENGLNLHQFVKMALPGKVMEIVEPSMLSTVGGKNDHVVDIESDTMEKLNIEDCLVKIMKIGVLCSMESPAERMDMRDVRKELCAIRKHINSDSN